MYLFFLIKGGACCELYKINLYNHTMKYVVSCASQVWWKTNEDDAFSQPATRIIHIREVKETNLIFLKF